MRATRLLTALTAVLVALALLPALGAVRTVSATHGLCHDPATFYPGAALPGANLSGADLSHCDLSGADLSGADLSGANLSGAMLWGAYLPNANLAGADLSHADVGAARLSGADLTGAILRNADLFGTDLTGADLTGVDATGGAFSHANLSYASVRDANLADAYLYDVFFYGADFSGTDLSSANLTPPVPHFNFWGDTTCPDGTNSDADDGDDFTCLANLSPAPPVPAPVVDVAGYFAPIEMLGPAQPNAAKLGSTVHLKFEVVVDGVEQTSTDLIAGPTVAVASCGAQADPVDPAALATGGTSLRYDAAAGQFVFNWSTKGLTSGACYAVTLGASASNVGGTGSDGVTAYVLLR